MPSRCFCLRGSRWADCRGLCVRGEWWDFRFNLTGAKLKLLIPPAARRPLLLSSSVSVRDEDSWRDRRSRSDLPYSEMWRGWIQSVIPPPPPILFVQAGVVQQTWQGIIELKQQPADVHSGGCRITTNWKWSSPKRTKGGSCMFLSVTRLQSVEASHITHRELGKKLFLVWKTSLT